MGWDALYFRIISPQREFYHVPLYLLLRLAALFYGFGLRLNRLAYRLGIFPTRALPGRVISVGNLTLGGTGKTPMVILVARILRDNGLKPAVLSRGYGGRSRAKVNVVADGRQVLLSPEVAGDEPVMIAGRLENVPVLTGRDRSLTGQYALEHFDVDVLILDDGFQHIGLKRDLNILLFDQKQPLGNGCLFPAGELREPVAAGQRADLICFTRCSKNGPSGGETVRPVPSHSLPVVQTALRLDSVVRLDDLKTVPVDDLQGQPVAAFCGIANPGDFQRTLEAVGVRVVFFRAFPDHHRFSSGDLAEMDREAVQAGAGFLLVSEKDSVKIDPLQFSCPVLKVVVQVEVLDGVEKFTELLLKK